MGRSADPPEQNNAGEAQRSANPSKRILIHQRWLTNPPKQRRRSPEECQSIKRILIHQRWLTNPPKQSRRSPEERQSIKKDIDPSEVVNQSTKAKQEKPRGVPIHQKGY